MCGIAGGIGIDVQALERMVGACAHRGPDASGLDIGGSLLLGMRRLSIIDVNGGNQPMRGEGGRVAVVFNGEIYNHKSLREDLKARGHRFISRSDTEILVRAYEEWGEECLERLRGMFALAVADRRRGGEKLFLARDRFGIKPLYYHAQEGRFAFASEVRALLASGFIEHRASSTAVESFLRFGSVAEPETLIEGVFSLPPGHCLTLEAGSGMPRTCRWWNPAGSSEPLATGEYPARFVRKLLRDSVREHLEADVDVGIFLSGGIDSSALAALASKESKAVRTVTVGFAEAGFDESGQGAATAEWLGLRNICLRLDEGYMLKALDASLAAQDQPSTDGFNTYIVSSAARQAGLKVVLSGLGGDELFGGYPSFRWLKRLGTISRLASQLPRTPRISAAKALQAIWDGIGRSGAGNKAAAVLRGTAGGPYSALRSLFLDEEVACLMRRRPPADSAWRRRWEECAALSADLDDFSAASFLETQIYMTNTLLRDADCMSMAHSIELRVPFLDHRLAAFLAALPARVRAGHAPKALLRNALRDDLPRHVLAARKRPFSFPWERWLGGALRQRIAAALAEPAGPVEDILEPAAMRAVWKEFLAGRCGWSKPWSLFILSQWLRRHLTDNACAAGRHR